MAAPHWTDAYYGDLYFDSAADLLTPALSAAEAGVIAGLLRLEAGDRVLDLACGHGRHAWPLAGVGARVVGLERSGRYLRRAIEIPGGSRTEGGGSRAPSPPRAPAWIRGDVRSLPFREGSFDAAFSWYASLFMFDDAQNLACLRQMGVAVRAGGRLLVHHANPARLARDPVERSRRVLADGSVVEEESMWDGDAGVDRCARRVLRPDGTILAGRAELRYYATHEWGALAQAAGLRLLELTSTVGSGAEAGGGAGDAPDLIAVLGRPA